MKLSLRDQLKNSSLSWLLPGLALVLTAMVRPGLAQDTSSTSASASLSGETIGTSSLVTSDFSAFASCGRWQPTGICVYLVCTLYECHTEETVKYGHYNPDLVVSAYNSSSNDSVSGNPWTEGKSIYGSVSTSAASSLVQAVPSDGDFSHGKHQNLIFKEGDAIGHPAALVTSNFSPPLCPTDATGFEPYFLSGLDAIGWRWQLPELVYPQSSIPGLREVGSGLLYTWGNLYPRSGYNTQSDDAKSAAVVAQRMADIVTRKLQPHVYFSLNEGNEDSNQHAEGETMVWSPGPIEENDATNGWWQMTVPVIENRCGVFGSNDLVSATGWGGGKIARSGSYAFTLWRPYQCCSINGAFLFSIGVPYPPASP